MDSNNSAYAYYDYYSSYNYTWETPTPHHQLFINDWVDIFMYIIVFVLGVPGNGLVVWVSSFEMKRTVNSVWFLNLAVADLLCCFSVPFSIMSIVLGYWPLGLYACKLIPSTLMVNMYASVLLLTVISIDRCALVVKPVWCQNKRTVTKAYVACLITWILAFLLSSPCLVFRHTSTDILDGKERCSYIYVMLGEHKQKVENSIAIIRLLMGFVIPFVVITVCYGVMLRGVQSRFSQSTRTFKMVLAIIIGFFICWLPYHIAVFLLAVHPSTSAVFTSTTKVYKLLIAIAFLNSCINPVIYVLMGRHFKKNFKKSLRFSIKKVLAEAMSETPDFKRTKANSETKSTDSGV